MCKEYKDGNACTFCDDGSKFKRMTNGDHVRNMTDEELADILIDFCACDVCEHHTEYNEYESCSFGNICVKEYAKAITQKWLQAEVEEGE